MHFLIKQTFSAKSRIFLISSKFRNFTKVFCICYWESLKYSNKSMIVKVAGRAMMSLLCSVHLLCSDEQVFCTAELLERTTLESRAREVLRSQQDSHLCQRVMFLIHSLSLSSLNTGLTIGCLFKILRNLLVEFQEQIPPKFDILDRFCSLIKVESQNLRFLLDGTELKHKRFFRLSSDYSMK